MSSRPNKESASIVKLIIGLARDLGSKGDSRAGLRRPNNSTFCQVGAAAKCRASITPAQCPPKLSHLYSGPGRPNPPQQTSFHLPLDPLLDLTICVVDQAADRGARASSATAATGRESRLDVGLVSDRDLVLDDHPVQFLVGQLPHVVDPDAMILGRLAPPSPNSGRS